MNVLENPLWLVWLFAGFLLGVGHAASLWFVVRRRELVWLPLTGLLRFVVLGAALTGAVLGRGILPAGAGWAIGFAAGVGAISMKRRPT